MQLYLVQHGAAKSEAEDPQRSLTAEGTKTVEGMAQYLSQVTLHVDRIEHSDKQRARQSAEIMAAHLHPAEGTRQVAGLAPNDDVGPMRDRLQHESKSLMIVGHLPYLSRLVSALLGVQQDRTLGAASKPTQTDPIDRYLLTPLSPCLWSALSVSSAVTVVTSGCDSTHQHQKSARRGVHWTARSSA